MAKHFTHIAVESTDADMIDPVFDENWLKKNPIYEGIYVSKAFKFKTMVSHCKVCRFYGERTK